ncbi:MAG: diguanylate cyclase [Clostridia bacterium]|nr:diguanylate cyclase [Clostridia bacterium]
MSDLLKIARNIIAGIVTTQFNDEVRNARFLDILSSASAQFALFLAAALLTHNVTASFFMTLGLLITVLFIIYHKSNPNMVVGKRAIFFFATYGFVFMPIIFFYVGAEDMVLEFLLMYLCFCTFFVINFLPALGILALTFASTITISIFRDQIGMYISPLEATDASGIIFSVAAFLVAVLTIGTIVRSTIVFYNEEREHATELFTEYHAKLYMHEEKSAYNDRFLITHLSNLAREVAQGQTEGFAIAMLSIRNVDMLINLTEEQKKETMTLFAKKINAVFDESDVLIKQDSNKYVVVIKDSNREDVETKLRRISTSIGLTMFQYFPKYKLTLDIGFAMYDNESTISSVVTRVEENYENSKRHSTNKIVG